MNYTRQNKEHLIDLCKKRSLPYEGKNKNELITLLVNSDSKLETQIAFTIDQTASNIKQNDTLFVQLKASNVIHYFNFGVLYPLALEDSEIYKNENRKNDIFTNFQEHIILSKGIINSFDDSDVLLEIITTTLLLKSIPDFSLDYISEPIPLSRVKQLHFKSTAAKSAFLSSAKTFPDSYVPEEICTVITETILVQSIDLSKIELPANLDLTEWKIKLAKFDRIMGLFSFMKNAGIFFTEKDNQYEEYSSNYFTVLSIINPSVKPQTAKDNGLYKYILFPFDIDISNVQRLLFRQIMDRIYTDGQFDLSIGQDIIQSALASELANADETTELRLILDYFNKLEKRQSAYKDLLTIDIIRKNYPVLALLFLSRFSNKSRQHTDKQAVRNAFISHDAQFNRSITEYLLGILGLYYGYKTMIKEDTNLKLSDKVFSFFMGKQQSIKFRFLTSLDRITVESIFNFCKKGVAVANDYTYLNYKLPHLTDLAVPKKGGSFEYVDKSFDIFNTKVTVINRTNQEDIILEIISKNYPENIKSSSSLLHYVVSTIGIDKKTLISLITEQIGKLDIEQLQRLIIVDEQQKNKRQ